MSHEIVFVLLFAVATAVALVARWMKVPFTVALVVTGLALGATDAIEAPALTQELLFAVFLPGLLFEAAFHLEFKRFWNNKLAVTSLAVPGLLAAIGLTAVILTPIADALDFEAGFELSHGLVFAALIAATDPIAVVGLFKSLGAPKRMAVLVEGESLINDGTAVVIFTLMVDLALGAELTLGGALSKFVVVAGAGGMVGLVFGLAVSWLTHKIEDPMIEITLTTIAAYGSFAVAEQFHVSGVIATVVAGMLCGNYGARSGMSASTKIAVLSFWEYWAFALNSFVFLLIGFAVSPSLLLEHWFPILVAFGCVMAARTVVVFGVSALLKPTREAMPWSWSAVLTWGGLRGSLSMVLVLGLPGDFPHREFLLTLTYGVVVLSILVQGLTMGPLLRVFGIVKGKQVHGDFELSRGQLFTARAALDELKRMRRDHEAPEAVLDELRASYEARAADAKARVDALHMEQEELLEQQRLATARQLLLIEKAELLELGKRGVVGKETFDAMNGQIDARLLKVEDHHPEIEVKDPGAELASEGPADR